MRPIKSGLLAKAAIISLLALFPATIHAATLNAINVSGDITLKKDANGANTGIHFPDGTSQFTGNPWGNGDPIVTDNIGFMKGNVGIGTLTPSEQLELTGNLKLPATSAKAGQIRQGGATLLHSFGSNNFFAGASAGNLTMSGGSNTAVGVFALIANTTGGGNTATGKQTLSSNTTGIYNTANGVQALDVNTTGNYNTANGVSALTSNTTGYYNTAVGADALRINTAGIGNTAIGLSSGTSNTTGNYNTFLGSGSNASANDFSNVTAIGYGAIVNASNKVRIGNALVTVIEGQVAMTTASDIRLKKDVADVTHGLDFIKQLRPVEYRMKQGNDRKDFGFIAQEVEALLGTEYNVLGIGGDADRTLSLRYTDFIAPLVKAVQEQQVVIGNQQTTIDRLKADNDSQKTDIMTLKEQVARLLAGR